MSLHVHGTIVTQYGVAANNRGETEGNVTTLQKILWKGMNHTTVSAEAIRYAIRLWWQRRYEDGDMLCETNRVWVPDKGSAGDYEIKDQSFSPERFIDDDVMGYMDAKAAKSENGESETRGRAKGTTTARRGPLEVSRAVSLDPYNGEVTFNARGGSKSETSLYATEVHATRYQYSFSLTPSALKVPQRVVKVIEAVSSLSEVGGNHGRFLYDFSPSVAIFRITQDPAPRILYVAEPAKDGEGVSLHTLLRRMETGDIHPSEVVVGGDALMEAEVDRLVRYGAAVYAGVRMAADEVISRLKDELTS
ncbi:type I-B CRISPR-associated protein Cas7/Cst2/DevR [Alicyclobacillus cellulosilyticus]|uniref:Type I-B CRISPR-associated protein Cas7/Cst2/DevR n=1 Tax=Alicyclobacillus cellulosilyticus TaxID=1003997 RepID=A0A917KC35_9BACL|nr:type I-B CRISPR-associated protein Cas7/Cst2/DevR [Alicyclobacillus cellulosilyticus]GGJ07661.1 type I-B CRISPR-associated protein Cas7/Cst2/DevR [Alicyclobacillus cellulosilyticus]